MKRKSKLTIAMATPVLAVLAGAAVYAQDKYSLESPSGIAFSDFTGYEDWAVVSSARTDEVLKVIVANPIMIEAYKAGVPGNGQPFPAGSKIVKLQWKPKKSTEAPFAVDVPDVFTFGAETAAAEDMYHGMLALQLGELAAFRRVVGKFVVGENGPLLDRMRMPPRLNARRRPRVSTPIHVFPRSMRDGGHARRQNGSKDSSLDVSRLVEANQCLELLRCGIGAYGADETIRPLFT